MLLYALMGQSTLQTKHQRLVQEQGQAPKTIQHDQELERTPEGLRVLLGDDGIGIEDLAKAKCLSHGLAGMMHRVRSLGGTFDVTSAPGRGTRILVFVPLRKP